MLGVTVMCANPLEDVSGAAQQLLGEVGGHLRLQPLNLHLLSALCIRHCLQGAGRNEYVHCIASVILSCGHDPALCNLGKDLVDA